MPFLSNLYNFSYCYTSGNLENNTKKNKSVHHCLFHILRSEHSIYSQMPFIKWTYIFNLSFLGVYNHEGAYSNIFLLLLRQLHNYIIFFLLSSFTVVHYFE